VTGARRTGAWRVAAAVAVAAVALSVVGLVVASASQLNVSGGSLFLQNVSRCTNATIATTGFRSSGTGNWNRVRLVGVPDACAGLSISVFVYRASGQLATGTGTAASGTVDITTGKYNQNNATGVALFIGGWGVPTTWTPGGTVISLRSFQNGLYVTAAGTTSPLIANSTTIGTNQQFDLTINNDGSVSLRAHGASNHYVTAADETSPLIANSNGFGGTSQKFYLTTNPDGTIALQSLNTYIHNGVIHYMYVCAENAGGSSLIANRDWIREWEKFYLVID